MKKIDKNIAIIGAGHMGLALFRGLVSKADIKPAKFILANPHLDKLTDLKKEFKIKITESNIEAVKQSDIIILSVKPKVISQVITEIKTYVNENKTIISVAACVPIILMEKDFYPEKIKIFRIMPNIPVAYGKGVVGWVGNKNINEDDRVFIRKFLSPLGFIIPCKNDENLEKLSMISGCGPGYVSYFMDNLSKIAELYGFSQNDAHNIVLSTFLGTGKHLKETGLDFQQMVSSIATKGGITEEVLKNLDKIGFLQLFKKSIDLGYAKIGKITKKLEKEN